jgi:cyclic nucleotide-binding protein/4Fe-4S binding protein
MFGRISERVIRIVRWALVGGWLLIIASLIFDPVSALLSAPSAGLSPFRINRAASAAWSGDRYRCPTAEGGGTIDWTPFPDGICDPRCAHIQGRCLIQRPYALGARVFWTMILPLVPLFLMVFGHEAWRRICPLSALMQIPRLLGIQRRETVVDPRTSKTETRVRLVKAGGFLARYFWFVQFGLLWLGLSFRLLFINSDRLSLAIFFSSVIVAAITVGYLFGGKTWCQYLCPISPVQKFYTEPRGLFESKAHVATTAGGAMPALSQSACRRIDGNGKEQSTCVACRAPCPDIDLERQYWRDVQTAGRRFFYYGYLGLVTGFYCYYRLYAGNWEYYFTGAWTHEDSQLATLFSPGWFLGGRAIPIPKVIAAPLTLALFIVASYACGRLIERSYDRWRERIGRPLAIAELRHRVFAFFTLVTFNVFYGFAGRPNISLFPTAVRAGVDTLFVVVSTIWFVTRYLRTTDEYERESIEGSLRRQLVQLRLDAPRLFRGRSINHLRTDEVYTLGRVLPELTASQGRTAYRELLRDAVKAGHTRSAAARDVLRSVRTQLKVSDEDHASVITELGVDERDTLDPGDASLQERRLRIDAYRGEIESILSPFLEEGTNLGEALRDPMVQARVAALQASYTIDHLEHEEVCQALLGSEGALIRRAQDVMRQLLRLGRMRAALASVSGPQQPLISLLVLSLERRREQCAMRVAAHLAALGDSEESFSMARMLASSRESAAAVLKVSNHLDPSLIGAIEEAKTRGATKVEELPLAFTLSEIASSWEPLARHIAHLLSTPAAATEHPTGWEAAGEQLERMSQLGASPLFEHLSLETLAELARLATARDYAPGELICTRGTPSDGVLVVVAGSAHILINTEVGTAKGLVAAGQTIGELGAMTGATWTDMAVATRHGTSVLCIPADAFRALLDQDAHAASGMLRLVSERLREARSGAISVSRPGSGREGGGSAPN